MSDDREDRARIVRGAWVAWAAEQPDPKPSWLVAWDELPTDDPQREVDARIGEAVAAAERERLAAVIPPERFRDLAAWFDTYVAQRGGGGSEVQRDLRRFADLLEAATEDTARPGDDT